MDVLKILKIFGEIRDIKKEIAIFYLKMCMKGRKSIADKILSKMGRKNIGDWLKLQSTKIESRCILLAISV